MSTPLAPSTDQVTGNGFNTNIACTATTSPANMQMDAENKPPNVSQAPTISIPTDSAMAKPAANAEAGSPSLESSAAGAAAQFSKMTVTTQAPNARSERGAPGTPEAAAEEAAAAQLKPADVVLAPLANASTEEELMEGLNKIMLGLTAKGKFLGITKMDMIRVGKEKRQKVKEMPGVWTKKVASTFGATLKRLNLIVSLEKKRDDAEAKLSRAGYLQQFGCLYGDSYSLSRVIRSQGLVAGVRFVRIDCGGQHASALTASGDVYTWGAGSFGQLGHGNRSSRDTLSKVENLPKSRWIACGYAFTCSVSEDGEMFAWGAGENGRLGTGDTVDICQPTKVQAEWKAKKIFAGSVHTCALSEDNELYSWGHRNYTGHGGTEDVLTPAKLETFEGKLCHMASIGPGGYHTMALTVSGSVYTWGHNRVGQLGFDNDNRTSTTTEGAFFYPVPRFVSALAGMQIRSVSAGWGHSAVLNYNGEVYMCGRNYRGQVGMQPSACPRNERGHPYLPQFTLVDGLAGQKVEQIACGGEHTAAVTAEGSLYLWGDDACAQLGHSKSVSQEYSNGKQRYKWQPHLVDGTPTVGKVVHVALGSAVTFLLSGTEE